jgi:hypothetical protein
MDAESQLLAEKDAEIERLEAKVEAVRVELRQQWDRMQKENLALKAEIERLKAIITKLADELDFWEQSEGFLWDPELKKLSREADRRQPE